MKTTYWKHYKGGVYKILHVGLHTEFMEEMVVYRSISDDSKVWIRPLSMWNDIINEETGQKRFEPYDMPKFKIKLSAIR